MLDVPVVNVAGQVPEGAVPLPLSLQIVTTMGFDGVPKLPKLTRMVLTVALVDGVIFMAAGLELLKPVPTPEGVPEYWYMVVAPTPKLIAKPPNNKKAVKKSFTRTPAKN
jgi:hypothetical protein